MGFMNMISIKSLYDILWTMVFLGLYSKLRLKFWFFTTSTVYEQYKMTITRYGVKIVIPS